MKKVLGLLLGVLASSSVFASESGPITKVKYIYSRTDTASPFIRFDTGGMPGCYGENSGYIKWSDEKGAQRTFNLLITALTTKQNVKVYYEFNSVAEGYNGWGLCSITAISIE